MPEVALAAVNEAAAEAGEQIARAGGNAVDATIAAALVAMVNEFGIVTLSSAGFLTIQPPDGSAPITIDGGMEMPGRNRELGGGTWEIETGYGGGVTVTVGPGSVATHGSIAAMGLAHQRWGVLPWAELFGPAIKVAREGFHLSAASRYYLSYVHNTIFGWDTAGHEVITAADGEILASEVVVPHLADTLGHIARYGPDSMYTGEIGHAMADDVIERGGIMSREDLAAYRPAVRSSLIAKAGDWVLGTNPPPSVGGVCVAAMMRLLDGVPAAKWTAQDTEKLIAAQRAVLGHRLNVLNHSVDLESDVLQLLELVDSGNLSFLESGSTAAISAVDSDGLACALTISSGYGSGMLAKGTGIWLNNTLGELELNPRGLHGLAPGERLMSNMAPTVARNDAGSILAISSPGADRITTAIVQVLAGALNGEMSLLDAINHRRIHVHNAGQVDEVVKVEEDLSMYYGGVVAAIRHVDGHMEVGADPRRDGATRMVRK